jgi:ketosteroid isomerase-like protein
LIVFGPRKLDAMTTRADALVAIGKVVDPRAKKHAQLRSGGLAVMPTQGGHSAWAFDIVNFDGQLVAVTAVLSNTGDLWAVSAAAVAAVPTARRVKAESARDAIVPPGAVATAKIAPAAGVIVEQFKKGLLDQQRWGDELLSQSDAIVAGPTVGQVARGKQAIRQLWKTRIKHNTREAISGDVSAAVTVDGRLAWLSAPVTRVADGEQPLPLRIFAVYEKDGAGAGAAWKLVLLHEALALDEPGSGTAFKKILPPAPPESPRIEPARPAEPTAAKTRNKTKKKRPRPRSYDR